MRILVTAGLAVAFVAGASAPAFAQQIVTVTGEPNNGVCVTVNTSDPVTQCVDLGQP
jgi:hypothetical protein